jgi:hypothetical protein
MCLAYMLRAVHAGVALWQVVAGRMRQVHACSAEEPAACACMRQVHACSAEASCGWLAQVFHPNIDLDGNVCLNILREDWKPVLSINSVIYGLQFLFLVRMCLQAFLCTQTKLH